MPRHAVNHISSDVDLAHVLDSKGPVTKYCLAHSEQRSWLPLSIYEKNLLHST